MRRRGDPVVETRYRYPYINTNISSSEKGDIAL
jgi:hypothetical protein